MKTIGLIGGTSWESTLLYYQKLNELTAQKLGGLHSARCLLYSLDFQDVIDRLDVGDWKGAGEISVRAAKTLEQAGADFILLCANTAHKSYHQIQDSIDIPILHLADVVADYLRQKGFRKVGLLGTKYTMGEDFYKPYLAAAGLTVCTVPAEEMEEVNRIIYDELCKGIIRDNSTDYLLSMCRRMAADGAEGVILGCTELGLILHDGDLSIPFFDTIRLHCEAAVRKSLN